PLPLSLSLPVSIIALARFRFPAAPDDVGFRRAARSFDGHGLALTHEQVVRDFLPDGRDFFGSLLTHFLDDRLQALALIELVRDHLVALGLIAAQGLPCIVFILGFEFGVFAGDPAPELGHAFARQARRARCRFASFALLLKLGKAGALDPLALDHLGALEFYGR